MIGRCSWLVNLENKWYDRQCLKRICMKCVMDMKWIKSLEMERIRMKIDEKLLFVWQRAEEYK